MRCGEDAFEPHQKIFRCRTRLNLKATYLDKAVVGPAVGAPVGSVGEDASVSLSQLFSPGAHVSSELCFRILANGLAAEILLNLDSGEADFNIDPATIAYLTFEAWRHFLVKITISKVQSTIKEESAYVCLHVSF
ncbi:hypothetical protein NKH77_16255 [Streptomyces sp. M19]